MPCGEFKTSYRQLMGLLRWRIHWAGLAASLPLIALFPLLVRSDPYLIGIATQVMIAATAVQGLNLILGYAGQISLAQGGLMAIGAYTFAILMRDFNMPWPLAMVLGALVAGLVGVAFGSPAIKIKLFYVAISTLALQFFVEFMISSPNYAHIFGAPYGIYVGLLFTREVHYVATYYVALVASVLATLAVANISRTSLGRALKAVRDNDVAAQVLGIDVPKAKLAAFGIGSFFVGLAGTIWAIWITQINPEQFTLEMTLDHYAILIFGGLGRVWGPWVGSMIIIPLIEGLKLFLPQISPAYGVYLAPLKLIILSSIIITLLIVEPKGVMEGLRKVKEYFRLWPYAYERG